MKTRFLLLFVFFLWLGSNPVMADPQGADDAASASTAGFQQQFLQSVGQGPRIFPHIWSPYQQRTLPHPILTNSPRLHSLIQDGKLELSLADALALTLENNLDIVVQRYIIPIAETDILRSKSGQAVRGFAGALYPSELNAGAIGAGVTNAGGTGGTGNAGGITGGGGAVFVGPAGAFDPSVTFGFSWDRVTSPLNSVVVSGIPTTTSYAAAISASYSQLFTNGTSYSVSFSGLRQSTTQQNTLFNPDVTSRLSIGFNQPLMAGFGTLPNERFMLVAQTNRGTAQEVFREQVINSVAQLEDAYWNLAAFQLNVRVAQESLAVSRELYNETKKQQEIGTLSQLDVVTAESQVAASERDLVIAQTNLQVQETNLKQMVSKRDDPELDAATVVVTNPLPDPQESDLPQLENALATARSNRPELRQAQNNLLNQDTAIRFTQNNMKPNTALFGLYASSGLQGNTALVTGGVGGSLSQSFGAAYPETAAGVSMAASIRNRSGQADNIRAQLERNQLDVSLQNTQNQIALQVRQSRIGLIQGRAQVASAHEAVRLAQVTLDAERKKLDAGLSTSYNVVLRTRDLASAQYAEVQAVSAYALALVAMDQSTGTTLERNGIQLTDAVSGTVSEQPTPPFHVPAATSGQGGAR
ncbi:MAG TPA: TolC family protein [Bryobacteraceae bacterium]|jgi:outer membrane protein TolC|nr:TolC family protein [Bryobacteraceae bacterium]